MEIKNKRKLFEICYLNIFRVPTTKTATKRKHEDMLNLVMTLWFFHRVYIKDILLLYKSQLWVRHNFIRSKNMTLCYQKYTNIF